MKHPNRYKPLSHNIFWAFLGTGFTAFFGLFIVVFIGNEIGTKGLGQVTLGLFVYSVLLSLFSFGSDWTVAKKVAESDQSNRSEILSSALILGVLGCVLQIGFALLSKKIILELVFNSDETEALIDVFALACGVAIMSKPLLGFFTGFGNIRFRSLIEVGKCVISITCILIFSFHSEANILVVPYSMLISEIIALPILLTGSFFTLKRPWQINFNFSIFKWLVFQGFPISIAPLLQRIGSRIDIIMINRLINAEAVGVYTFVIMIPEAVYLLSNAFQKISTPIIVSLFSQSRIKELETFLNMVMHYSQVVFCLIAVLIFAMAWEIPRLLYIDPSPYLAGVTPMRIFLITMTIIGTYGGISLADNLCADKSYFILYRVFTLIICNSLLNLLLIPKFHLTGAALSTLAAYCLIFWLGYQFRKRNLNVSFKWNLFFKTLFIFLLAICFSALIEKHVHYIVNTLAAFLVLIIGFGATATVRLADLKTFFRQP
jgi:O-antigen/teichoic acid export membrane protein